MQPVPALSALLTGRISASNTNSMCLAVCLQFPYSFFTGIFSELFSAQSLQLIGSTSLRLRFWNESPAFARRLLSQRAAWETKESESYCFLFGVGEGAQIPMFEQCTLFGGAALGAVRRKSLGRDSELCLHYAQILKHSLSETHKPLTLRIWARMNFVLSFGLCTQMCWTDGSRAQVWR